MLPKLPSLPALVAVSIVLWIAAGLLGVFTYVHHYSLYRGFAPPKAAVGVAHGTVQNVSFFSPALHQQRSAEVYLPPGYKTAAAHGTRFPVLYLLHGHPGSPRSLLLAGALAPTADRLIGHHLTRPMIIVMPSGGAPSHVSDEWANAAPGAYESFVLDTVHMTDQRFATQATSAARVIGGLSEGGFGAANVALHNLGTFSGFESWSGYFTQTAAGAFAGMPSSAVAANSPALYVPRMANQIRQAGMRAFLYAGASDPHNLAAMRAFAPELSAAGAQVQTAVYPGGHDWGLWRGQMPHMIELAGTWMR